jgi:hypothetical protein
MQQRKNARLVLAIFTLTALLYNSWPLGFILDKKTAQFGLASDLETAGHPYYWVFILADVLVGLALLIISIIMKLKLRREFWSKSWLMIFIGLLVFGLFTTTSAAAPVGCAPHYIHLCATINKRTLGPDGLESTVAALGIFVSLVGAIILNFHTRLNRLLRVSTILLLAAWTVSGIVFVLAAAHNLDLHTYQQVLLIVTGLALLAVGLNIYFALERNTAASTTDVAASVLQ